MVSIIQLASIYSELKAYLQSYTIQTSLSVMLLFVYIVQSENNYMFSSFIKSHVIGQKVVRCETSSANKV